VIFAGWYVMFSAKDEEPEASNGGDNPSGSNHVSESKNVAPNRKYRST
jgi:hypothetical protein